MNLEQAIQEAIRFETLVRDVYERAIASITDPAGKRILGVLAKEEQGHLDYLQSRLQEWTRQGKINLVPLPTALPPRQTIQKKAKPSHRSKATESRPEELSLLGEALQLEKETSNFYRQMVKQLDGSGQALFETFVSIEDGHLTLVQAEIDNLQGIGYWLDFKEFDLEAG